MYVKRETSEDRQSVWSVPLTYVLHKITAAAASSSALRGYDHNGLMHTPHTLITNVLSDHQTQMICMRAYVSVTQQKQKHWTTR